MTDTKTCRECGGAKLLDQFYKHAMMADGHLNKCKDCVRDRVKRHRTDNLDRIRKYDRDRGFRNYDPEKTRARRKVNYEIEAGRLTRKPCSVCGGINTEAHHADYSKALDVEWLCKTHHAELHRS